MTDNSALSNRTSRIRSIAAYASLLISIVVLFLKIWAFHKTGSQAIYSDAVESIVNIITAIVAIGVIVYASKPVDKDHPYGHGKIEYVSAAFEGGLISFAAILVIFDAVKAQFHHEQLSQLSAGLWLLVACALINWGAGYFLKFMGKKHASPALESSGVHLLTDFGTTVGALVGVALVKSTGLNWIDRAVAVLLGLWMGSVGLKLVRQSASGLLDAEDLKLLERLAVLFQKFASNGIIQIHHARIIRSGWYHHIDAHVVVPEFWSINEAHARLEQFEASVFEAYGYRGEANFHLDPCKRKYCAGCDFPDCPVRREKFVRRMPVVLEHLRSKEEPV